MSTRPQFRTASWGRVALLLAAVIVIALPLPGWIAAVFVSPTTEWTEPPAETREYAFVRRHLLAPFDGYGTPDVLAPQFGIVALSHMASGLMNVAIAQPELRPELRPLIEEVVRRGRSEMIAPLHRSGSTTPRTGPRWSTRRAGLFYG